MEASHKTHRPHIKEEKDEEKKILLFNHVYSFVLKLRTLTIANSSGFARNNLRRFNGWALFELIV